jgi:hypothetical protein
MGDIAIAFGNGATATAPTGLGSFAFADGTNAAALVGGGNNDTAIDIGNNTTGLVPRTASKGAKGSSREGCSTMVSSLPTPRDSSSKHAESPNPVVR